MGSFDIATNRVASTLQAGAPPPGTEGEPVASALAEHSRFVQRIRRRYPAERAALPPGLPGRDGIVALIEQLQRQGRDLGSAMRVARQLTLERLAVLDVEAGAPLADITRAMTDLAGATSSWPWPAPAPTRTRASACRATRPARRSTSGSSAWASSARAS